METSIEAEVVKSLTLGRRSRRNLSFAPNLSSRAPTAISGPSQRFHFDFRGGAAVGSAPSG
jgi:hypothetical protein